MTSLDHQTATLTEALVYRLRNRGSGPGQYATDDDVFAREFIAAALGHGWRPTEAGRVDWRDLPAGDGLPSGTEARAAVDAVRAQLAARETGET